MALDPTSRVRFNLSAAAVLLLDPTPLGMSILVQIVTGFGARTLYRCATAAEAREVLQREQIDIALIDAFSPSGEGYELVEWLRRSAPELNRYTPVLLTEGHTRMSDVARARDCGANFLVKRPLSPVAMLERIVWVSKEGRGFVLDDNYVGPDRRFKTTPMPNGGRRREDRVTTIEEPGVDEPGAEQSGDAPDDTSQTQAAS
jgi:CheY-like chemotaxis protein